MIIQSEKQSPNALLIRTIYQAHKISFSHCTRYYKPKYETHIIRKLKNINMNKFLKTLFSLALLLSCSVKAMDENYGQRLHEAREKLCIRLLEAEEANEYSLISRLKETGANSDYLPADRKAIILKRIQQGRQLLEAAKTGDHLKVQQLLEAKADVNYFASNERETALIVAAKTFVPNLETFNPWLEVTRLLIKAKADVDFTQSERDKTALAWAAKMRNPEIVDALIAAGGDVYKKYYERDITMMLRNTVLGYASNRNPKIIDAKPNSLDRSRLICEKIIAKMLRRPNVTQTKRMNTFLCCMMRIGNDMAQNGKVGFAKNIRSLFKGTWIPAIFAQENKEHFVDSIAYQEIQKCSGRDNAPILWNLLRGYLRNELELHNFLAQDPDIRYCQRQGCSFAYSLEESSEEPWIGSRIYRYVFGGPTFECPKCSFDKQPIEQPKERNRTIDIWRLK